MSALGSTRGLRLGRAPGTLRELPGRLAPVVAVGSLLVLVLGGITLAASGLAMPRYAEFARVLPGSGAQTLLPLGVHLTMAQFHLAVGAMGFGYAGVLMARGRLRARWVLTAIAVLHVAFFLSAPLLSSDVFSYIAYARLGAVHGLDPYVATPSLAPHDPVYPFEYWRFTRSAYGPLFTLISYGLAQLSPGGMLLALKALFTAASLGCVGLVWMIAVRARRPPVRAVAIFGLNPVLLAWTVAGAHNDLLMLLAMLGGVALVAGAREGSGAALVVMAAAIKASAGLAIPFAVLGAQRRWRAAAGVAVGAVTMVTVAVLAFPSHAVGMFAVLAHQQHFVSALSMPRSIARLVGTPVVPPAFLIIARVALGAALAWQLLRTWRRRDWLTACGWGFVALDATTTWMLPWYLVWPLPFAAVTRDRRLLLATLLLEAYYVVNQLPLLPP
jgi:alpha-1,6-mannosyltransferase